MKNNEVKTPEQNGFMAQRRQILNKGSAFAAQEAYKTLRTNVRFALRGNGCKRICITSGAAGEGKSITFLNFAISVAESGQKVLLIDADMRRPVLARLLVEKATPGLSNVLAGLVTPEEAIHKDMYQNLDVIFSGDVPPNPSELLGGDRLQEMIEKLSSQYDYILIDTPPVNVVSDACLVANVLDGVLLLVRQDSSRKDEVKRAVTRLQLTGAKLLGFILNDATIDNRKNYSYYG